MKVLSALRSSYNANDIRLAGITTGLVLNGKYANTFDNIKVVRFEEVLLNGAEAELMPGGDPAKALLYYNLLLQNRVLNYVPAVAVTLQMFIRKKKVCRSSHGMFDFLKEDQHHSEKYFWCSCKSKKCC
jgi:hypothetical protein